MDQSFSFKVETWGQFGDFISGLLNPIVAGFAFYWLTRSVTLQKDELMATHQELKESRLALKESSESQAKHADSSLNLVRVSVLTALINSRSLEAQRLQNETEFLIQQFKTKPYERFVTLSGESFDYDGYKQYLVSINHKMMKLFEEISDFESELKFIITITGY